MYSPKMIPRSTLVRALSNPSWQFQRVSTIIQVRKDPRAESFQAMHVNDASNLFIKDEDTPIATSSTSKRTAGQARTKTRDTFSGGAKSIGHHFPHTKLNVPGEKIINGIATQSLRPQTSTAHMSGEDSAAEPIHEDLPDTRVSSPPLPFKPSLDTPPPLPRSYYFISQGPSSVSQKPISKGKSRVRSALKPRARPASETNEGCLEPPNPSCDKCAKDGVTCVPLRKTRRTDGCCHHCHNLQAKDETDAVVEPRGAKRKSGYLETFLWYRGLMAIAFKGAVSSDMTAEAERRPAKKARR